MDLEGLSSSFTLFMESEEGPIWGGDDVSCSISLLVSVPEPFMCSVVTSGGSRRER